MDRKFHVANNNKKSVSNRVSRASRRRPGCIRLFVCPTTGGRLEISVSPRESVLGLKAALARKLRVPPSKITLIFKDKVLKEGRIQDHQIPDDSLVTLLPNMESGLSLNPSDKSIMQALENLTETQVNDFLSGRSPLMLAIRMGENMVFVQLQLSMLTGQAQGPNADRASQQTLSSPTTALQSSTSPTSAPQNAQQPSVTPITPATAAMLSQTGLSPSALAQATRCLSQRLQRLHMSRAASATALASQTQNNSMSILDPKLRQPTHSPSSSHQSHASASLSAAATTAAAAGSSSTSNTVVTSSAGPHSARVVASSPQTLLQLPPRGRRTLSTAATNSGIGADPDNCMPTPPPSPGAIIDNMKHLGRGVYTGTFQGTLDPALQDSNGQPHRSVNTILHILNDLLVAAPNTAAPLQTPALQNPPPGLHARKQQAMAQQQGSGNMPSLPLTPPASPVCKTSQMTALTAPEDPDNAALRQKMQRVQMMLAQRKEQRRTRRELSAPYSSAMKTNSSSEANQYLPQAPMAMGKPAPLSPVFATSTPSSTSPVHMEATASAATQENPSSTLNNQTENGGSDEPAGNYRKANIEQDSVAV